MREYGATVSKKLSRLTTKNMAWEYFLECERKQSVQFWRRRFLFESPFAFEQKATLVVAPYKDKVTPRFNETAYIIDWTDWSDDDEF